MTHSVRASQRELKAHSDEQRAMCVYLSVALILHNSFSHADHFQQIISQCAALQLFGFSPERYQFGVQSHAQWIHKQYNVLLIISAHSPGRRDVDAMMIGMQLLMGRWEGGKQRLTDKGNKVGRDDVVTFMGDLIKWLMVEKTCFGSQLLKFSSDEDHDIRPQALEKLLKDHMVSMLHPRQELMGGLSRWKNRHLMVYLSDKGVNPSCWCGMIKSCRRVT